MKKAVIYTRVSDPEQLSGLSLDVQKEVCAKWAKKNGYQITGVYEDGGKTGTKTVGRHGLEDLIICCQEEHIDVALVIDTDRIARNEFDHFYIRRELKKAGTRLVAVNQPMIDESAEGQLMDGVIANINAFTSRLTGRKVKKSLEKKLNDGHWPGWSPIGYVNVNKGSEEKPHRIVEKDPDKHLLITELFRLYSTGNYSVDELVDMMYDMGLRSKNNKRVYRSVMYHALKNPFYIGLMRYKGELYKGKHEALTSPEIFETCQKITQRNNHNACRRRKYRWLLSGFAYCQECQTRLYSSWNHKKKLAYYHGHVRNGCNHYFSLGDLEEAVAQELKKIQFSEKFTQKIIDKAKELVRQSRGTKDTQIQSLRNSAKKLEDKRNLLEDHLLDQTIDKESFKRKHNELNIRIQNLENEIATIENQKGFDIDVVSEILSLTTNIYETYSEAKFEAKRHYLSIFFEKFEIDEDGKIAKIAYTPLFQKLLGAEKVSVAPNWLPGKDSNLRPFA